MRANVPQQVHPRINMKVRFEDNSEIHFKIRINCKLRTVYAAVCTRKALAIDSVSFLFNGGPIPPNATAGSLGLVDGDDIFAMLEPVGN